METQHLSYPVGGAARLPRVGEVVDPIPKSELALLSTQDDGVVILYAVFLVSLLGTPFLLSGVRVSPGFWFHTLTSATLIFLSETTTFSLFSAGSVRALHR